MTRFVRIVFAALLCAAFQPVARAYNADILTSGTNRWLWLDFGTNAPVGTKMWFMADINGNGVNTNVTANGLIQNDNFLLFETFVDGTLPGSQFGRYRLFGLNVNDAFAGAHIYVYLWNVTNAIENGGDKFGIVDLGILSPPEFGNATWTITNNLYATNYTLLSLNTNVWAANNSGNWSTAGNWTNPPAVGGLSTNYLRFGGNANYSSTNDFAGNFLINILEFTSSAAVNLSGNALVFTNEFGVPIIQQLSNGTATVSNDISVASLMSLTGNGSGPIVLAGVVGGTNALVKTGTGTFVFARSNSFSGGLLLQNGTVLVGNDFALGTNRLGFGDFLYTNVVTLGSADASARTLSNSLIVTGAVAITFGQASGGTGDLTLAGGFDLGGGARSLTVSNGLTRLSGVVTHGGITKSGPGLLALAGNNTFTNGVLINEGVVRVENAGALSSSTPNTMELEGGTLRLNGVSVSVSLLYGLSGTVDNNNATNATLTVNAASDADFSGSLTNGAAAGTLALTKAGTGSLSLSTNNAYAGGTDIKGGALLTTFTNAFGSGVITLGGGTLALRQDVSQTFGPGLGYIVTLTNNSTVDVDNTDGNPLNIGNVLSVGSLSIGTNTLTVQSLNSYLFNVNSNALLSNSTINLIGGGLSFASNATLLATNSITNFERAVFSGTNLFGTNAALRVSNTRGATFGNTIILNGANSITNTADVTLAARITNGAQVGQLIKGGPGTLYVDLFTNSSFSGGTILNEGVLQVSSGTNVLRSTFVTTPLGTNTITINGGTLALRSDSSVTNGSTVGINIVLNTNATIDVDRYATNTGRTITVGSIALGTNQLTVTGNNTYVLRQNVSTTLSNNTINVTSNGINFTYASNLLWWATNTFGGVGNFTVSGAVTNGTNAMLNSLTTGSTTFSSSNRLNGTNIYFANGTMTLSGTVHEGIVGSRLLKTGPGTLSISGSNTFSGGVDISSGTVQLNGITTGTNQQLGSSISGTTLGAAVLSLRGTTNMTFGTGTGYIITITNDSATINVTRSSGTNLGFIMSIGALNIGTNPVTITGNTATNLIMLGLNLPMSLTNSLWNVTSGGLVFQSTNLLVGTNTFTGTDPVRFNATNAITANGLLVADISSNLTVSNLILQGAATISNTQPAVLDGLISGNSGTLGKTGNSTLYITNLVNNTYNGGTILAAGTTQVAGGTNFATLVIVTNPLGGGPVTLGGGTLQLRSDSDLVFGPASSGGYTGYDVLLTSNATINVDGINANASNGIIYLGSISTPGGLLTVTTNDGYRLAVNDSILSNQSLRVSGALLFTNTVHFYGTNNYSGTFVSTNGATGFLLHPSVGLTVLTGATLNLVGAVSETGPSTLTKDGLGTLTINSNSSYSGATFLNAGTLGSATADLPTPYGTATDITILGSAGVLSVAPQTTLQLRNNTANFIFGPGSGYNLNVLNGNVTVDINRTSSGNPIGRINNLLVSNAVLTFGGANNPLHVNGNTTISGTSVFRTSSGQTHVLVGPVAQSTAGTIFVKQGADSLILSNATAPAFSGGTIVEQGTLIWRPTNLVSGSYGFGTGPIYVDGGATFAFQNNVTAGFFLTNDLYIGARDLGVGGMRSNDVGVLNFDSQANAPQVTNTGTIHLRGTLFLSASGGAYSTTIQPVTLRNVTIEGGDGAIWTANSPTGTGARQVIDQLATDGQKRNLEIRAMGGSTVEFIGNNSGFTGDWAVRQSWRDATGVLRLTNASALPAGKIIVEPGAMIDLTFNPTNLTGGSGSLASLTSRIDFQAGSLVAFDGSLSNVNLNFGPSGLNRDVRLGSVLNFTLTNNPITPFASTYKLGGGGGALTLSTTNSLTGARNLLAGPNPFNDPVEIVRITPIAAGTLVMNASNNYTGGTVVQSGTLQIGHSNALGAGAVEIYGTLQMLNVANAATGFSPDGVTNRQSLTFHPGSTLILDRRVAGGANQFGDAETLTLNGALLRHLGSNGTITTTEFITNLNYSGAARVSIESQAAVNNLDVISVSNLTRIGNGTMEFIMNNSTGGNQFLGSTNRFLVGNTNGAFAMANGMVSPFIVNGSDRSFVTYDPVIGFTNVTYTSTDLNTAASTDLVNIPAGSATNLTTRTVYALRVEATNTTALTNYAAVITISSGGLIYSNSGVTLTNQPQLSFAGTEALLYVNNGTLVLANTNPILNASTITKFGAGNLTLIAPSVTYANGWNLNQGNINVTGSNVLGADDPNNLINLNGNGSILRFNTSATTAGYSSGKIVSLDNNIIALDPGGNDRQMFIAPFGIDLNSVSNGPLGSRLRFQFENRDRVPVTVVGPVTLNADATLDVVAVSGLANINGGGTGGSNRVIFAGTLNATNHTLTKLGNLNLVLAADNSLTATNLTINVNAGTLTAGHNGAFGGTTNSVVNLLSNTVLELPSTLETFQPLAKVNQLAGSAERWQSDANRFVNDFSTETYQVPTNVHLQIAGVLTNLTGKTIALNGGSLEGYQYIDDNRPARGAMLGAGYTVLLNTNSFIGQSGVDLGRTMITNGVNFLTNDPFVFSNNALITGTGSLTKIGVDTVELGNTNNYTGGTLLAEGILRNGVTNALPTNGLLFVTNYARYDLHGFNQTLAGLFGNSVITNTGTNATLFLRLAVTNVSRYSGMIAGAIDLDEDDPGSLDLAAENTFTGTATIHNGLMKLSAANALGGVSGVTILGGTLQLSGAAGNRVNDSAKVILGGGTIDSNNRSENFGALTLSANSTITLVGTSVITFQNSSGNTWSGNLFIQNWSGTPVSGGGAEQLKFGSSASGLTAGQVGEIFFVNPTGWDLGIYFGKILSSGEVVPVPEPATWGGAAALLALAGAAERRRLARWLRRHR